MKNINIADCQEITLDEAKKIMLNILVEFDRVCKKHNLTYWLTAGTLLGSVRHSGFIPWDDDIDIGMPREDYEKLKNIELPKNMFLQNKSTDPTFRQYFTKIRLDNTLFIEEQEKGKKIEYHQGIFIDIFPFSFIDETIFPFYSYIRYYIYGVFSNNRFYAKWMNRDLRIYAIKILNLFHNNKNAIAVYGPESLTGSVHHAINKNDIFPLDNGKFEGYSFPIPKNSNFALQKHFGKDVMEIPPENSKWRRMMHHYKIYIKR